MYKINIRYNDKLIEDNNQFEKIRTILKSDYGDSITFEQKEDIKFEIKFNDKIIYSLEDSFDSDLSIDNSVLSNINFISGFIFLATTPASRHVNSSHKT